jgi:hypothetical protein
LSAKTAFVRLTTMSCLPFARRASIALLLVAALLLAPLAGVRAQQVATVSFNPDDLELEAGEEDSVDVEVEDAEGLFSVEITINFDPAVVEVVDADPEEDGVQVELGGLIDAELVTTNEADNETGELQVAYSLDEESDSEPADGDGVLLTIQFLGVAGGPVELEFDEVTLANEAGDEQEVTWEGLETATATATEPEEETPTEEPSPTEEPPTPTEEPPTPTAEPEDTPTEEPTPTTEPTEPPTETSEATETVTPTETPEGTIEEEEDDEGLSTWAWVGIGLAVAAVIAGIVAYLRYRQGGEGPEGPEGPGGPDDFMGPVDPLGPGPLDAGGTQAPIGSGPGIPQDPAIPPPPPGGPQGPAIPPPPPGGAQGPAIPPPPGGAQGPAIPPPPGGAQGPALPPPPPPGGPPGAGGPGAPSGPAGA